MALRRIAFYRSLARPQLLLGAERELVLVTAMLAAALVFAAQSLFAAIAGCTLWGGGLYVLRRMAQSDPAMSRIYLRHIRYRLYYPARARTTAKF